MHDVWWKEAEYLPGFENFEQFLQLLSACGGVWDFAGPVEDQVHQVVDVRAKRPNVRALHVLQDAVHVVYVFDVVLGRLRGKRGLTYVGDEVSDNLRDLSGRHRVVRACEAKNVWEWGPN